MRALKTIAVVASATAAMLVATSAPATAAPGGSATYSGTFTKVTYSGNQAQCPKGPAKVSGTWTVTIHGQNASAYFDITNASVGEHVAFSFPNMKTAYSTGGTVFVAYGETGAGLLTVTLYPDRSFTYVIAPYNTTGLDITNVPIVCDRVTYYGVQTA